MQVAQQFPFPTLSALATNHHRVQRDYLSFPKTNGNLYIFRAFFPRNFPLSTRLSYLVRGKEKRKHLSRRKIRSIEQFIGPRSSSSRRQSGAGGTRLGCAGEREETFVFKDSSLGVFEHGREM